MESVMTAWYEWAVFLGVFIAAACAIYVVFDSQELGSGATLARILTIVGAVLTLPSLIYRLVEADKLAGGIIPGYYLGLTDENWFLIWGWLAIAGVVLAVVGLIYYFTSVRNSQARYVPPPEPTIPMTPPPVASSPTVPRPQTPQQPRPAPATVPIGQEAPPVAWLVVRTGPRTGHQFGLSQQKANMIGRDPSRADIVIDDDTVSREHARVRYDNGQFVIHDLASTSGTYVNGNLVQRQLLYDNDRIGLGRVELVYKRAT